MLNLYLLLSESTSLKSQMFLYLVKFSDKNNQLPQVMIKQVQQIKKVAAEWELTEEDRIELFIECGQALENNHDH